MLKSSQFFQSFKGPLVLCPQIANAFGIYRPKKEPYTFQVEISQQRDLMKLYRGKMITAFWDRHTQVENNEINAYNRQQTAAALRGEKRRRGSMVKLSYGLFRQQNKLHETEQKKEKALQKYLLDQENQRQNRKKILMALEFDSQHWVKLDKLNEKLEKDLLIPRVGASMTDYYLKLKEMTFFLLHGDYESMESIMEDVEAIQFKNSKLIPLFTDVKMAAKHLSISNENHVIADFEKEVLKLQKSHVF